MTDRSRNPWLGPAAAVVWTMAILALCSIPGRDLPEVDIISIDKIGHFAMFAGFGWLWMRALPRRTRRSVAVVFVAGLAYAILTEVYQGVIPIGREPDLWDAVANAAGLIVGIGLSSARDLRATSPAKQIHGTQSS